MAKSFKACTSWEEFQQVLAQRAFEDPEFNYRLRKATKTTLNECGVSLASDAQVELHQNTLHELHLVLPLIEEELSPQLLLQYCDGNLCCVPGYTTSCEWGLWAFTVEKSEL